MGSARQKQQRYDEALALYEEAVEIYTACVGRQSVACAQTLNNMGEVRRKQRRYDEALALYEEAVEIYAACGVRQSVNCARALNNMGLARGALGLYDEALALLEEAREVDAACAGPDGGMLAARICTAIEFVENAQRTSGGSTAAVGARWAAVAGVALAAVGAYVARRRTRGSRNGKGRAV
eukprot:scaffold4393_cov252-Prasinococcus_capsulatus_cf.AAC.1